MPSKSSWYLVMTVLNMIIMTTQTHQNFWSRLWRHCVKMGSLGGEWDARFTPWKTNMTMENWPFEDVFPIKHGDSFQCHLSFQGGVIFICIIHFFGGFKHKTLFEQRHLSSVLTKQSHYDNLSLTTGRIDPRSNEEVPPHLKTHCWPCLDRYPHHQGKRFSRDFFWENMCQSPLFLRKDYSNSGYNLENHFSFLVPCQFLRVWSFGYDMRDNTYNQKTLWTFSCTKTINLHL